MTRCADPVGCGLRHCVVCVGHLEPVDRRTCVKCLGRVRRNLADVLSMYALLPAELGHATARPLDAASVRSGEAPLPGGVVLALLAPGSAGAFWRDKAAESRLAVTPWRPVVALQHEPVVWSEDAAKQAEQAVGVTWEPGTANPHRPQDAPSVAHELATWEDDWRTTRKEPAADSVATVAGAVNYLSRRAGWAADHHPAFNAFATDVARLHAQLEVATAMDSRPLVGVGVVCFECQVELRREWTDKGLSDDWTCPRCWRAYDQRAYWLAVREHLESSQEGV